MKALLQKTLRYCWQGTLLFVAFVGLYLAGAVVGAIITTGTHKPQTINQSTDNGITIYITSNGVHTNIVLPTQHAVKNWQKCLPLTTLKKYAQYPYISFGWGDKDFFLQSTHHNSPRFITILKATFVPSPSLMHLSFYRTINPHLLNTYPLVISSAQYQALVRYILASFALTPEQKFRWVAKGYGNHDLFFRAKGRYHLFNTCNNWTNRGLKKMGINTGVWTPFEQGVLYNLK
ncbi:TIGR02117 family protein [uncultured Microscilla sp.]|uniref:TIGR02117 family protein n=1 Tax=uncultured Microscilla sp. TaxID=432653 RepID=UPI0026111EFB|nr:TIGR02117 family protein [uncultured Microscilla sp.]